MKKVSFWTLLISGMLTLAACSNDNEPTNNDGNVPQAVLDDFQTRFGDTRASWSIQDGYAVANFTDDGGEATAWYELNSASWGMTKTEIPFASLPEAVNTAFSSSTYASWTHDDTVDVLERNGVPTLYVIEVNNAGLEFDICYTEDGIMISEEVDSDGKPNDYTGYLPQAPTTGINSWIEQNYPGARIVDIDKEDNGTEVEIIYDNSKYEIWFDKSEAWQRTKREYGKRNIPDVVTTFVSTNYPNYRIDDVDQYFTPDNTEGYYCIELEQGDREHKVYMDAAGNEIQRPVSDIPTDGGDSQGTLKGIENVLNEKYPGYRITDRDYDDGLIEIEIRHDGKEKDVYFTHSDETWVYTNYDIRSSQLPEAVKSTLNNKYGTHSYLDEDAECYETPKGTYYEVEVWDEMDVLLDETGEILRIED